MTEPAPKQSRHLAFAIIGAAVLIAAAIAVNFAYTAGPAKPSATFSPSAKHPGLNDLTVAAPHGMWVITFDVVPSGNDETPFRLGGRAIPQDPVAWGKVDVTSASYFPSSGGVSDFDVETPVLVSSTPSPSAVAEWPDDVKVRARCGVYVLVTRDRSWWDRLEAEIEAWKVE